MATRADTFDRANSTSLGSNWAEDSGNWEITSNNVLNGTTGNSYRKLRWVGTAMDSNDYSVEAPCRSGTDSHTVGPAARMAASSAVTYYALVIFAGYGAYIVYINAGAETILDSSSVTINSSTTYTLRLEVEGTAIRGYVNDTLEVSATHSALTSGPPGLAGYGGGNASTYATGWTASDLSSGVSGSAAITQAAQTVAAAGAVAVRGSAALTQASNTLAATGTVPLADITGSAAITQAAQTVAAAGVVAIAGSAAITQAGNSVTMPHALRFYGNAVSQIDRVRIPLEDGVSTQYPVNVGAGDFTYDVWLRCAYADNDSTATDEDARYADIVLDRDSWGEQRGHVVLGVTRSGSDLVACFGQAGSGGSWSTIFTTSNIGDSEWHHVAVTRTVSTGVVRIWVDGVQEASGTYDTSDWSFPAGHTVGSGQDNEYLVIGTEKHDVGFGYNGQLDELRISDSVRYTATFTPGRRFEPDADAVGLYHLDDATGTVASDSATVAGAPTNGELLVGGSPSGPVWVELPAGIVESAPGIVGAADLTQAAQTMTATGVVAVAGASALTQAAQTVIAAGVVTVVGASSMTQASQTVVAVGVVAVVGSANVTQDGQTVTSAGVVAVVGSASMTQDGQTVLAVGVVTVVGAAALTQSDNTLSAAGIVGSVPVIGSAAITQDNNTLASAGVVAVVGSVSLTQNDNTVSAAGVVAVVGAASIAQDGDTLTAVGYVGNVPIIGSASMTQDSNTLSGTGAVAIVGASALTQASHTVAAAGAVAVVGSAALTQDGQIVAATGVVAVIGVSSMTQDGNTVVGTVSLDLVLAVVFGTVLGVRAAGTVRGVKTTGDI